MTQRAATPGSERLDEWTLLAALSPRVTGTWRRTISFFRQLLAPHCRGRLTRIIQACFGCQAAARAVPSYRMAGCCAKSWTDGLVCRAFTHFPWEVLVTI